jgi:hypothetical protein
VLCFVERAVTLRGAALEEPLGVAPWVVQKPPRASA